MFIFMCFITLVRVDFVYLQQNTTSKQCALPRLRSNPLPSFLQDNKPANWIKILDIVPRLRSNPLPSFLQDNKPANWIKILDIVSTIGTPLHDWRESNQICIRGDNTITTRHSIHCFKVEQISRTTENLYDIYREADDFDTIPNLNRLDDLSKSVDHFETIDYYLLLKIVVLTPDEIPAEEFVHFMNVVRNVVHSKFGSHKLFIILNKLTSILYNIRKDFQIINPDFVLTLWHPFRSNVSGFALYDNQNQTSLIVRPIFRNQSTHDIDKTSIRMAGIIPDELLEGITKKMPSIRPQLEWLGLYLTNY
ncbi:hypothetical protein QE152_g30163 [Popillia japonica]|uniref:Uncharacterized protein n=1 Tax=Popillia japonica TaxID=7064 RepID=A0AAW1JFS3_POPJA